MNFLEKLRNARDLIEEELELQWSKKDYESLLNEHSTQCAHCDKTLIGTIELDRWVCDTCFNKLNS